MRPAFRGACVTVLAAALSFPSGVGAVQAAPAESPCPLSVTQRAPGWTSIEGPSYTQPPVGLPRDLASQRFAVAPEDPNIIFMGAGTEIYRSMDGGCTWKLVFPRSLSETPVVDCWWVDPTWSAANPGCPYLYDLDAVREGESLTLYAQFWVGSVLGWGYTYPGTMVFKSTDAGETWAPIPLGGDVVTAGQGDLVVTRTQPHAVYVTRTFTDALPPVSLYASQDAGQSWNAFQLPASSFDAFGRQSFDVSPGDPKDVWVRAYTRESGLVRSALYHSNDGGASWELVPQPISEMAQPYITAFDVAGGGDEPVRVVISSNVSISFLSLDEGRTWRPLSGDDSLPEETNEVEFGKDGNFIFGASIGRVVWRYDVKRHTAYLIKDRAFAQEYDQDSGNVPDGYYPGAGYYLLGNCQEGKWCHHLYRFAGRGT